MQNRIARSLVLTMALLVGVTEGADEKKNGKIEAAAVDLGRPVDFQQDVLPVLENNCIACHNVAIDEGKLNLEDVDAIFKGGKRGPAVVAKDPEKSLIFQFASRAKNPAMPPMPNQVDADPLSPKELGILRQWILEGANKGMGGSTDTVLWQPIPDELNAIYSVALSPWGRMVAAGRANQIAIYDLATKKLMTRLVDPKLTGIQHDDKPMYPGGAAHRDFVHSLAFSPDGNLLASGGYRLVKLWKRPQNVQSAKVPLPAAGTAVAVSADGRWAAIGSENNSITLWDIDQNKAAKTLTGHSAPVTGLQFFPTLWDKAQVDTALASAQAAAKAAAEKVVTSREAVEAGPQGEDLTPEQIEAEKKKLADALAAAEKAATAADEAVTQAKQAVADMDKKIAEETRLFSGSADKTLRIWNLADGKVVRQIDAPAPSNDITLNKDATQIISADADNIIRVWATAKPEPPAEEKDAKKEGEEKKEGDAKEDAPPAERPVVEIKGHSQPVTSVDLLLPAGTQIVSGGDNTVRIWNLSNGQQVRAMNHGAAVTDVAARPDGQVVASVGENNVAKLWQVNNGQQKAELKGDLRSQRHVASLVEEQNVVKQLVTIADNKIKASEKNLKDREEAAKKAAEAQTKAEEAIAEPKKKADEAAKALDAAKAELAKKPDDANLKKKVSDAQKAKDKADQELKKVTDALDAAKRAKNLSDRAVEKAKTQLAEHNKLKATRDEQQKQIDAKVEAAQKADAETLKPLRSVAFSVDGSQVAATGDDNLIHLWHGDSGQPLDVLAGHTGSVSVLAFGAGDQLLSGSADKTAVLWDTNPEWQLLGQLGPKPDTPLELAGSPFADRVLSLAFSPDGKLLATGGGDPSRSGELMIWDVEQQKLVKNLEDAHSDTVLGLEFSRNGEKIVSGAADKFVKMFDVKTGKHLKSFEGHTHHVLDVSWQADGTAIASAGADNVIKVWNVETGEQKRTIKGYNKQVTSIQFIGIGANTVSSGGDKTVRFHTTSNGRNYRSFSGGTDYMYCSAATRDEKIVVGGGEDGVLRVWNGTNGQSLATFEPLPRPQAEAELQASASK